jgi:hypothetical protein
MANSPRSDREAQSEHERASAPADAHTPCPEPSVTGGVTATDVDATASQSPSGRTAPPVAALSTEPSHGNGFPPAYQQAPPVRAKLSWTTLWSGLVQLKRTFRHLLEHTLGTFSPAPDASAKLGPGAPAGVIGPKQLAVCERVARDASDRLAKLEQKATTLLSVVAVVAPLTASTAVYIRQQPLSEWAARLTLIAVLMAAAFVLLAFFAVLRALAVRGHQFLYVGTVIDPTTDKVRSSEPENGYEGYDDFYGRGLLWEAMNRNAVCDHLADFVRGSQVFLALSVIFTLAAALPVLAVVHDSTQHVAGTISLDSTTLRSLRTPIDAARAENDARMDRVARTLDSLRARPADPQLTEQLEAIRRDIAVLRKRLSPTKGGQPLRTGRDTPQ